MKQPCENRSSTEEEEQEKKQDDRINCGRENVKASIKATQSQCGFRVVVAQLMAKKKHRGIIEKRRRDRINLSLAELRCLVPGTIHKQGSAKLEKVEILQMTVDHLKKLQTTVGNGPTTATDFVHEGFRECVSEVSRYLGQVEGVDAAAPWWSDLLSHLTSCVNSIAVCPFLQQRPTTIAKPLLPHQLLCPRPRSYIPRTLYEMTGGVVIKKTVPSCCPFGPNLCLLDYSHTLSLLEPPDLPARPPGHYHNTLDKSIL